MQTAMTTDSYQNTGYASSAGDVTWISSQTRARRARLHYLPTRRSAPHDEHVYDRMACVAAAAAADRADHAEAAGDPPASQTRCAAAAERGAGPRPHLTQAHRLPAGRRLSLPVARQGH
eukprot:6189017-Pleurochrysis_carterae.AAC.1